MIRPQITIRIDATYQPTVTPGETVCRGQQMCDGRAEPTSPIPGTIRSVSFDPEAHEFVIVVAPAPGVD